RKAPIRRGREISTDATVGDLAVEHGTTCRAPGLLGHADRTLGGCSWPAISGASSGSTCYDHSLAPPVHLPPHGEKTPPDKSALEHRGLPREEDPHVVPLWRSGFGGRGHSPRCGAGGPVSLAGTSARLPGYHVRAAPRRYCAHRQCRRGPYGGP